MIETITITEATEKRTHESDLEAWRQVLAATHMLDYEHRKRVTQRLADLAAQIGLIDQFIQAANDEQLTMSIVYEHKMSDGQINRLEYVCLPLDPGLS